MRYLIIALLLAFSNEVIACDICGGVSGNASIGLFASTKFHTIGYRSTYRSFTSYLYGIRHSQEFLFSQDIQFRAQIHKRIQLIGAIPYQLAYQKRDLGSDFVRGVADPNLIGNFILIQQQDSTGVSSNFLSFGMGVKLPLGKNVPGTNVLKNLYPGAGSWDYLFLSNFTKQFSKSWGWQTEASYALRGKDKYGFQYGNTAQLVCQVFKSSSISAYRMIVAAGINYEHHLSSRTNGQIVEGITNAGYILSGRVSVNLLTYRWLWSLSIQQPVFQHVNDGIIRQRLSGTISLNYLLKKQKNETTSL
jgi:hypothetical protein